MAGAILQTKRLTLRELTWDDLDFVATMLADPQVMRHWPKPYSRDEATAWLQKQFDRYRDDGYGFWLVSDRSVGACIGQVGLLRHEIEGVDEVAIGYLIHAPYWRQGYATEAAAGVREYAFGVLAKNRVITLIRPANIPSQRVALRIGLKPEKLVMFRDFEHLVFSSSQPVASGCPT